MPKIKLTSKRQATFPKEACEALRVGPGDFIEMEPGIIDGQKVFILKPKKVERPWLGFLKDKARKVDDHSMEAIRQSIVAGRKRTGE
ncbi:hypothetical protein HQ447_15195 [bacterium]|nr:hypothetical protein [bacterium]